MSGPPLASSAAGGFCLCFGPALALTHPPGRPPNSTSTSTCTPSASTTVAASAAGAGGGGGGGGLGLGPPPPPQPAPGPWLRAHCYKLLLVLVVALLLLQYTFSSIFEARQLEPLFAINGSSARALALPLAGTARRRGGALWEAGDDPGANASANGAASASADAAAAPWTPPAGAARHPRLPPCPLIPPNLEGAFRPSLSAPPMEQLAQQLAPALALEPGGAWRPGRCTARHRVAVVVPYRDRAAHLATLLAALHPLLHRQQIDYRIIVVEQAGSGPFNRAMLMNIGYVEALKLYDFQCFIFHDVDLLPEDDRNLYTCPEQPRHMSVAIDVFRYRLPYNEIFGGVSAMTKEQFSEVNGFSNMFWGWGGEDDDMSNRIKYYGFHVSRYPVNVARYKMLTHRKQRANPKRYEMLYSGRTRFKSDGLNSLRYTRKELNLYPLYTRVLVELASPS